MQPTNHFCCTSRNLLHVIEFVALSRDLGPEGDVTKCAGRSLETRIYSLDLQRETPTLSQDRGNELPLKKIP